MDIWTTQIIRADRLRNVILVSFVIIPDLIILSACRISLAIARTPYQYRTIYDEICFHRGVR